MYMKDTSRVEIGFITYCLDAPFTKTLVKRENSFPMKFVNTWRAANVVAVVDVDHRKKKELTKRLVKVMNDPGVLKYVAAAKGGEAYLAVINMVGLAKADGWQWPHHEFFDALFKVCEHLSTDLCRAEDVDHELVGELTSLLVGASNAHGLLQPPR